jgi:hypothetical protein
MPLLGLSKSTATMRLIKDLAEASAFWNDTELVQVRMRSKVVRLDVLHVDSLLHTRHLIDLTTVVQYGIGILNRASIALEVHDIDLVEALRANENLLRTQQRSRPSRLRLRTTSVTNNRTSASVNRSPHKKRCFCKSASKRSNPSVKTPIASSYASWVLANPQRYTPLLIIE